MLRRGALLAVVLTATTLSAASLQASPAAWAATNWVVHVTTGSKGEAQALALPAAPTGVTATCTSPTSNTVKVSWSAVTHATTYTVYDSTTGSGGTYNSVASGVTTTTWTSSALATGTYYFKVAAVTGSTGSTWVGTKSTFAGPRTISATACA
jgi:cellulose 1,4-beta-cellobiosidase